MMHRIESVLLIILGLMGATVPVSAANTNAPPRLDAVGPIRLAVTAFAGLDDRKELKAQSTNLADLLTIQLSQSDKFQLVERRAIDSVTEEMSLSLSQVSKPADAIHIGKMLRADWLLVGSILESAGTNTAIVKILDAQTGIIRDLTAISVNRTNLFETAAAVADFVNDSAGHPPGPEQRVFLGIGGFEDLSINNRCPDFRKFLRAELERHFHGSRYAIVERSAVEPLLEELRLNLAGLSEQSVSNQSAQPAFLLVDGTYQSYPDAEPSVNLVLRVEEIGAGRKFYSFKQPADRELYEKIAGILSGALDDIHRIGERQTQKQEAATQIARGMERCRIDALREDFYALGGFSPGEAPEKRLKNITEGMAAFEAALLLDPDNAEAKIYLAICLLDPAIGREEDGRNYLREVIAGCPDQATVRKARLQLARSYSKKQPVQALNLLLGLARDTPDACARMTAVQHIIELRGEFLNRPKPFSAAKGAEILQTLLMTDCEAANDPQCFRHGFHTPRDLGQRFDELESFAGYTPQSAEACFEKILPEATAKFPVAAPRVWMSYAVWCQSIGTPLPEPVRGQLRASLKKVADHPEEFPTYELWRDYLPYFFKWSVSHSEYKSAEIIGNLRVHDYRPVGDSAQTGYYLGYCYRGMSNWSAAETAFAIARTNAESMVMDSQGPWGAEGTKVFASALIAECRQHLSPSGSVTLEKTAESASAPIAFSLGQPMLTLSNDTVFACDGNDLWVAAGSELFRFDTTFGTLTELKPPAEIQANITYVCCNDKTVWWGTAGDGLIEMDKQTRSCKVLTEKDGLLLNQIARLALDGEKLWIGFEHERVGGVGYLDLRSHRFIGLTPELDLRSVTNRTAYLGLPSKTTAPRYPIHGLVPVSPENLWVLTDGTGLQDYSPAKNEWSGLDKSTPIYRDCLDANSEFVVRAGNGGVVEIRNITSGQTQTVSFRYQVKPRSYSTDQHSVDICSLRIMGKRLWVGGDGFVALVNLECARIERLCDFSPNRMVPVQDLQIDGDSLWVAAEEKLYRLPAKDFGTPL